MRSTDRESTIEKPEAVYPRSERRGKPAALATKQRYLYRVYGLTVESEVALPELTSTQNQEPDVQIRFGEVPETLDNQIGSWSWCMASSSEFVFSVQNLAKYHIAEGRRITIERRLDLSEGARAADLRLWLLGSAFGALLHQRGSLPLHVSAVKAPGGVWAFTGESGEGKSTLAGFLHKRYGWPLVSDDVSVIEQVGLVPFIQPGPRKLKLWADALEHLEFNGCKSVRDLSNTDKFQLYLPGESGYQPQALHALVILESADVDEPATMKKIKGVDAFNACLGAVYRPYMDCWFKRPEQRMTELMQLCKSIEVYRFRRPRSLADFEVNLRPLLDSIAAAKSS